MTQSTESSRSKRRLFARSSALLCGLLGACMPAADEPTELQDAFEQASEAHDVPVEILMSISWSSTRFRHVSPDAHQHGETVFGVMGIHEEGSPSLYEAATLSHASPSDVSEDLTTNVMGAAAWLRDAANGWGDRLGAQVETFEDWYPVVAAYSGASDPAVAEGFAHQVYDHIEFGLFEYSPTGEFIQIEPSALPWRGSRQTVSNSTLVDQFIAACSSNYSPSDRAADDITKVVIHTVQGSYGGCISWFQNCTSNVSTHYVIQSSDGEITQMLDESDIGWHAGNWDYNESSIGIEHEGYVEDGDTWYTEAMYQASAALVADIASRNDIPVDRDHIVGHVEVPGTTHTDPGSYWDWDYFMELVRNGGSPEAPQGTDYDGPLSGGFVGTVYSTSYGIEDKCEGTVTGQVANGQVYLTGTCQLATYGDRVGDIPITWTGAIQGNTVTGNMIVESYVQTWQSAVQADGTIGSTYSGSRDLGGDIGTLEYQVWLEAQP